MKVQTFRADENLLELIAQLGFALNLNESQVVRQAVARFATLHEPALEKARPLWEQQQAINEARAALVQDAQ